MNIVIAIMLVFSVIGLVDKTLGGRFRLAPDFDKGAELMGTVAIVLVGIYCMGIYLADRFAGPISQLSSFLPFDPSVIIACLLCPDTGGLTVSLAIASSRPVALYCGMIISTALGVTLTFQLPAVMNMLRSKEDVRLMMRGLSIGIITIVPGLIAGALILRLPFDDFIRNTIPVLILCFVLVLGLKKAARVTTMILTGFGNVIRGICLVFFAIIMAGVFVPRLAFVESSLVADAFIITGKMMVVVCGAMVLTRLLINHCKGLLGRIGSWMGINEYSVIGLLLNTTSTFAMLPLFPKMDRRGKLINAAFSAAGAYIIGGQMAFCSSITTGNEIASFFAMKFISGAVAILAVCLTEKNPKTVDKPKV